MREKILNSPNYKWFALGSIQLAIFLLGLDVTLINLALPSITAVFPITLLDSHWVLSMYFVVAALFLPVAGRISDLFQRKPVIIIGCSLYAIGAFLAIFSPSLNFLIGMRAIQGIGCAALLANTNVITMALFPAEQRGLALGLNGSAYSTGFSLGFLFGGYLIDAFGWRSIFALAIALVLIALLSALFILSENKISTPREQKLPFDYPGAFLSIIGIGTFMIGFQNWVNTYHIDQWTVLLFATSFVSLICYIFFEERSAAPLVNIRLLMHRTIFLGLFNRMWMQWLIASTMLIIPFFSQIVLKLDSFHTGFLMLSYAIALFIFGPIGGSLSHKVRFRLLTSSGFLITAVSLFLLTSLPMVSENKLASILLILSSLFLMGIGAGLFVFPDTATTLSAAPQESMGAIAGIMWVAILFGNTFGTTFSALMLNQGLKQIGSLKGLMAASSALSPDKITLYLTAQSSAFLVLTIFSLIGILLCWLNPAKKT